MRKLPQYEILEDIRYNIDNPERLSVIKAKNILFVSSKKLRRENKKKKG
jgi:hypothetical protein